MPSKSILIADDDAALTRALAIRCRALGADVRESPDGLHAFQSLVQAPPDMLILDVNMPGADGLRMCEVLARDTRFMHIPVIILTGQSDDATLERCQILGACHAPKGTDTWKRIRPKIVELLQRDEPATCPPHEAVEASGAVYEPGARAPCVLVIDDDADCCRALQIRLESQGMRVIRAGSGMRGYWTAARERPDAIITDYLMPDGLGNHVIRRLRENPLTAHTPLFVLSGQTRDGVSDDPLQRELLELGATRCFGKPPDFDAILSALRDHLPSLAHGHSPWPAPFRTSAI